MLDDEIRTEFGVPVLDIVTLLWAVNDIDSVLGLGYAVNKYESPYATMGDEFSRPTSITCMLHAMFKSSSLHRTITNASPTASALTLQVESTEMMAG